MDRVKQFGEPSWQFLKDSIRLTYTLEWESGQGREADPHVCFSPDRVHRAHIQPHSSPMVKCMVADRDKRRHACLLKSARL
ncbi:hypothetical protein A6R68_11458, partial [Neotoma lepida]